MKTVIIEMFLLALVVCAVSSLYVLREININLKSVCIELKGRIK